MSNFRNSLLKACSTGELDYSKWRGVFIEDVNGDLWNIDDWDGSVTPNGVAVLTDECRFVMALELATPNADTWVYNSNFLLDGVTTTESTSVAIVDYNGQSNTTAIIKNLNMDAVAANWCRGYTFPNGQRGYLGAAGEWCAVTQFFDEVEEAFAKCGFEVDKSSGYWTSTQANEVAAWMVLPIKDSLIGYTPKEKRLLNLAFTTLKSETL